MKQQKKGKLPPIEQPNHVGHIESTKSEKLGVRSHDYAPSSGNFYTNDSNKSGSRLPLIPDHYGERKMMCKHIQMKIRQAKDKIRELQDEKMEASEKVKKIKLELQQLTQQHDKVVYQGCTIEFKLKNEEGELQKMGLKIQAESNAKKQLKLKSQIQICELNLKEHIEDREMLSTTIKKIKQFINENRDRLVQEQYHTLPPINPKKE